MKKIILLLLALTLGCANNSKTNDEVESSAEDNQAAFMKNVEIFKTFPKGISSRDLDLTMSIFADSLKWFGPEQKTSDSYASKPDLRTALEGYLSVYNESSFKNDSYYGGNLYSSKDDVSSSPNGIRIYGDWHHTHMESGKAVSHKWMSIVLLNEDGQIHEFIDYFDVGGFLKQHEQ
jgi:hypothetical protein